MKSLRKAERFDYSKFETDFHNYASPELLEYEFWGIHPKKGRLRIDTKRYKKICKGFGIDEFLPNGLFKERNTVYFIPAKQKKYDYKVNIFRDLLGELIRDWVQEYKPVLNYITTPKEVADKYRLEALSHTSCSDDYDDIGVDARMESFRRERQYSKIINSLYCQFVSKITAEVDRYTLIVMSRLGYQGNSFNIKVFCEFSDKLLPDKKEATINNLSEYSAYDMLHKINNFLKHNSVESYKKLKKAYPDSVISEENGVNIEYKNGMFAGDWITIKPGYIDEVLNKLIRFFEDYCRIYLNEDIEESKWNYDDYFKNAFKKMSKLDQYFGLDF